MLTSEFKIPIPAVDLKQALTDIIETTAMEDAALGKILACESEMLDKAKKSSDNLQEFVVFNESANGIVKNVAKLQIIIQFGLEDAKALLQETEDFSESDDLEE